MYVIPMYIRVDTSYRVTGTVLVLQLVDNEMTDSKKHTYLKFLYIPN